MKTAVSVPDELFQKAEHLARRMKKSRSELFSTALREYVARHASDTVTEALDKACGEIESEPDRFTAVASRSLLKDIEW